MKNKSLEALERISNIDLYHEEINEDEDLDGEWIVERDCVYDGIVSEIYKEELDTIKQDLEAYEQLKQDHDKTLINNGELVVKVEDLKEDLRLTTIERTNCEDLWEEEHLKCCELEKENQELKEKAQKYDELCKHNVMESQSFGDDLIQGILALNKRVIERNKRFLKALDKACEMIAICPPFDVNVEECEKVENECKDCWKRYLLKEVLENE